MSKRSIIRTMHWTDVWYGRSAGAKAARVVLTPLSWLYAFGWEAYEAVYDLGLKKPKEPHRPIVCIGNLTTGGSGKSPLTLHVYDLLKELGKDVVISCSGYGSPASEAARLTPEGELKASVWGDEPAMIRWLRPDAKIIVGRRRVLAAEICHLHHPKAVMLMDDGYQHLPLKKHLTIILDPPSSNTKTLPAGPYREPRRKGKRGADLVLPGRFSLALASSGFQTTGGEEVQVLEAVNVLCAIGSPQSFVDSLEQRGLEIVERKILPDHDPLSAPDLFEGLSTDLPIVVTAKDWVKLRERRDVAERKIWIARHEVRVEPADEFKAWLKQRVDEIEP